MRRWRSSLASPEARNAIAATSAAETCQSRMRSLSERLVAHESRESNSSRAQLPRDFFQGAGQRHSDCQGPGGAFAPIFFELLRPFIGEELTRQLITEVGRDLRLNELHFSETLYDREK